MAALGACSLLGMAVSPSAMGNGVETFSIQGNINFQNMGLGNTYGIATGDSFTGTISYNTAQSGYSIHGPNDQSLMSYSAPSPLVTIFVQGQEFDLSSPSLYVFNSGSENLITTAAGPGADPDTQIKTPWGSFDCSGGANMGQFTLENLSGSALSASCLPTQLNLADWADGHQIVLSHNGSFYMDAEITSIGSITDAPEPSTVALLGLGTAGVLIARFHNRKRHAKPGVA